MSKTCGKCGGRMEQGFSPDTKDHGSNVGYWVEGVAKKSFWGFLKTHGRTKLPIEVWRCSRCGLLESYAPAA